METTAAVMASSSEAEGVEGTTRCRRQTWNTRREKPEAPYHTVNSNQTPLRSMAACAPPAASPSRAHPA